jgi:hypothetical protein
MLSKEMLKSNLMLLLPIYERTSFSELANIAGAVTE